MRRYILGPLRTFGPSSTKLRLRNPELYLILEVFNRVLEECFLLNLSSYFCVKKQEWLQSTELHRG